MTDRGTVERHPYVGDSDIIVVKCAHGDYDRIVKGGTEAKGQKCLDDHWNAKHGICSCGNSFDGDNFCMLSACQWEE